MAARHQLAQTQQTREAIRTAHVLRRLEAFVLGEDDPQTDRPVQMTGADVKAALILLRKTLPDLRAVEVAAAPGTAGGYVVMQPVDGAAQELTLTPGAA